MCALVVVVFHQRERGSLPIYFSGLYNWRFWGTVGTCVCMCRRFIWRLGEARAQRTRQSGRGIFPFSPSRALFFITGGCFKRWTAAAALTEEKSPYIYIYISSKLITARNPKQQQQQTADDCAAYVFRRHFLIRPFRRGGKINGGMTCNFE